MLNQTSLALLSAALLFGGCTTKTVGGCGTGYHPEGGICVPDDAGMGDASSDGETPDDTGPDVPSACATACSGETPHCDEEAGTCVRCLENDDCSSDGLMCSNGDCVECTDDSHCTDPSASLCSTGDEPGQCIRCTDNAHCDGISGPSGTLGLCDTSAGADMGICVECTPENESACGGNSCNPATGLCTETPLGSVPVCGACVADSECGTDHLCVPMNFDGTALDGGFCLKTADSGCERPFLTAIMAESLSGVSEATYCGVDQNSTTCHAVRAMLESRECTGGDVSICADNGGRCEMVGLADNRCTISCGVNDECPSSGPASNCNGYCGGPM